MATGAVVAITTYPTTGHTTTGHTTTGTAKDHTESGRPTGEIP